MTLVFGVLCTDLPYLSQTFRFLFCPAELRLHPSFHLHFLPLMMNSLASMGSSGRFSVGSADDEEMSKLAIASCQAREQEIVSIS